MLMLKRFMKRWSERKHANEADEGRVQMAFVLTNAKSAPDAQAVLEHLERLAPGRHQVASPSSSNEHQALSFEIDGGVAVIALMPFPVPESDLRGPCECAWWWPEAVEVCRAQTGHFIVTCTAPGDAIEQALRLSDVVAAVASASGSPAVYWGAGTVVNPAKSFFELMPSASRDNLPLPLWIELRVQQVAPGDFFFATTGMQQFNLMELEAEVQTSEPADVAGKLLDVAHYLCDQGPVLQDGQTIGASEEERICVRHVRSRWDRPGKVLKLEFAPEA